MQVVSERRPTEAEWQRAARSPGGSASTCARTRSCSPRDLATVGIGAGQMSRVDSVRLALEKARDGVDGRGDGLRRLLPVPRRARARARGRGRPRSSSPAARSATTEVGRGGRRGRRRDGVHRPPPLPRIERRPIESCACGGDPPSPWEGQFGFSRVVARGPFVLVGGTTSVDAGRRGARRDARTSRRSRSCARSSTSSAAAAPRSADVIQTRVYVTDISRSEEVGRAHGEVFGDDPAADDDGRGQRR